MNYLIFATDSPAYIHLIKYEYCSGIHLDNDLLI